MRPHWITALLLVGFGQVSMGQVGPPMIRASKPLGAAAGESVALEVRLSEARDGSTLRFDDPSVRVEGVELGKAEGDGLRTLKARVTLPKNGPGPVEFRVVGGGGVSNPGQVWIGRPIGSVAEVEPNDRLRRPQLLTIPAAVEGAIEKGDDVDVFAVDLNAGETVVAEVFAARSGWSKLDAIVAILSPDGRELAGDDDLFGRDAAAWATAKSSGRYLVTIQDANGKHPNGAIEQKSFRPYRLEIGRFPIVTSAFPAGARRGEETRLHLCGANLPQAIAWRFDPPTDGPIGEHVLTLGMSNPIKLRLGQSAEMVEDGSENDDVQHAMSVDVPAAINGRFAQLDASGADVDVYRLKAAVGSEGDYRITAMAAQVGSPADPVLAVLGPDGKVLTEDDDKLGRDARLIRRVDSREGLLISVRDYFGRGGERFVYRIEVEPVARSVAVVADLGHRTIARSGSMGVPVTVERLGFDGPVTVLAGELPSGVVARPVTIASGETRGLVVFSASSDASIGAFPLRLTARDIPVPASFTFAERGPIDEIPRENEPGRGPRETSVVAKIPVLAVASPSPLRLSVPGRVVVNPGETAEIKVKLERPPEAARKPMKVRLVAAGKGLEGFEPIKDVDITADVDSVTFVLRPKGDTASQSVALIARAWPGGTADVLGVDSTAIELVVPDRP